MELLQPLEEPADHTQHTLTQVTSLSRAELGNIIDTLSSLVTARDRDAARIYAAMPIAQVAPSEEGWSVTVLGTGHPHCRTFSSQRKARAFGRTLARANQGTLMVHRADGSLMRTYHYGDSDDAEEIREEARV